MKEEQKGIKLYNLIFPFWTLVWLPTWLWLILIPANYVLDRTVFTIFGKRMNPNLTNHFFRKHTWKLWLLGFLSDFIGSALLLLPLLIPFPEKAYTNNSLFSMRKILHALQFNAFHNPFAFAYTVFAIAVAGLFIYLFDRRVIYRTGEFTNKQANKIALFMAIFTAPYLYLLPTQFIYHLFYY